MKKTEQTLAPSLAEFQQACLTEFAFLVAHGFRNVQPPRSRHQNPFEVHFKKGGWCIIVCGLSYGFALDLQIRSPDGRVVSLGHFTPPEQRQSIRDEFPRGQLGEIAFAAKCLRSFGDGLLRGDWSIFDELERRQLDYISANREAWIKQMNDVQVSRALEIADPAFRLGKYREVVAALSPVEKFLTVTQRKKLEIAKSRQS